MALLQFEPRGLSGPITRSSWQKRGKANDLAVTWGRPAVPDRHREVAWPVAAWPPVVEAGAVVVVEVAAPPSAVEAVVAVVEVAVLPPVVGAAEAEVAAWPPVVEAAEPQAEVAA